jgi:hypothetical protein
MVKVPWYTTSLTCRDFAGNDSWTLAVTRFLLSKALLSSRSSNQGRWSLPDRDDGGSVGEVRLIGVLAALVLGL